MQDRKYLLSIKELIDADGSEQLMERACLLLDQERFRKLQSIKPGRKRAESVGAGLLLQLAVQQAMQSAQVPGSANDGVQVLRCANGGAQVPVCANDMARVPGCANDVAQAPGITEVTLPEIFENVQEPARIQYRYGEFGKPYFENLPYYFSISHSAEYVFLVLSTQEVGADIQYVNAGVREGIVRRFFSEAEREIWMRCGEETERRELFYKLWCRKEAYAKLTGEGIPAVLGKNMMEAENEDFRLEEYQLFGKQPGEKYQLVICKWK